MMQHCAQWLNCTVSTYAIVACNIARNVTGVEASSTSATFHATIALCVCLLQYCTQWCDVTKSFQPIRFRCLHSLVATLFMLHVMLQRMSALLRQLRAMSHRVSGPVSWSTSKVINCEVYV